MALNAYIRGTKFADLLNGSGLRDKIYGKGGADVINAGAGNDKIKGDNGDDLITGGGGNDSIDGGKGYDTAIYQGNFQDYVLSFADKNSLSGTVTDNIANRDGTDTLKNVEFLQFKNAIYDVANDIVYMLNQPPTLTVAAQASYTENNEPVTLSPNLSLTDVDSPTLVGATVKITSGFIPEGPCTLHFIAIGNITGIYDVQTRTLTLTGLDSVVNYQAALASVTFDNLSDNPTSFGQNPTRTIEWQVDDGSGLSNAVTTLVTINAINDAAVVTATANATGFIEGDNTASTPVAIDPGLTLSDADNTTLASAKVQITSNLSADDILAFVNTDATAFGNIAASYDAGVGLLTLTSAGASATVAQWQTTLRAVTFTNDSNTPDTADRTVSFTVNDGAADSSVATKTVSVMAVDDGAVNGTDGEDTLIGTPQPDIINGLGGNDHIFGRESGDILDGGADHDVIDGEDGDDTVIGNTGDDSLFGGPGSDTIFGGFGEDILAGGSAPNPFLGDDDFLNGGEGNDIFAADAGNDSMIGGDGDDIFESVGFVGFTGGFADNVDAGPGNDFVRLLPTGSTVTLGSGQDTVAMRFDVNIHPTTVTDFATGPGGDHFDFGEMLLFLTGWDGNTNPIGTFVQFAQNGTATDFQWDVDGSGPSGWQTLVTFENSAPADFIQENVITGYPLDGTEPVGTTFPGTNGEDAFTGTVGADTIFGLDGNDNLSGSFGHDVIDAGADHDLADGGGGDDSVSGGPGFDTLTGGPGNDTLSGGDDDDFLYGEYSFNDFLEGNDTLNGDLGNDVLVGGTGNDILIGGPGNDTLTGDSSLLFGSSIVDHFVFNAPGDGVDTVTDFGLGFDIIEISAAGFGGGLVAGNSVTLVTAASAAEANSGPGGYFIFDNDGIDAGTLYWDATGGDGTDAIALAHFQNVATLHNSDFLVV